MFRIKISDPKFKCGDRVVVSGLRGTVVGMSSKTRITNCYEVLIDKSGIYVFYEDEIEMLIDVSDSEYYTYKIKNLKNEIETLRLKLKTCEVERDKYKEQLYNDHWRKMYFDLQMEMRRIQIGLSAVQKRIDKVV